jgi:ABC-type dipeptide/oligopeptide/nickel transport system permease component
MDSTMIWQVAPPRRWSWCALLIGAGIGIPLGIAAATRRNSLLDYFARVLKLTGFVIPGFW